MSKTPGSNFRTSKIPGRILSEQGLTYLVEFSNEQDPTYVHIWSHFPVLSFTESLNLLLENVFTFSLFNFAAFTCKACTKYKLQLQLQNTMPWSKLNVCVHKHCCIGAVHCYCMHVFEE
jgi:hypothetical protein